MRLVLAILKWLWFSGTVWVAYFSNWQPVYVIGQSVLKTTYTKTFSSSIIWYTYIHTYLVAYSRGGVRRPDGGSEPAGWPCHPPRPWGGLPVVMVTRPRHQGTAHARQTHEDCGNEGIASFLSHVVITNFFHSSMAKHLSFLLRMLYWNLTCVSC